MAKSYRGKSLKPGGGGRFAKLVDKIKARGGIENPEALAAVIGRRKYGAKKMATWAAKGRKRAK